jgi:hypothetical protein
MCVGVASRRAADFDASHGAGLDTSSSQSEDLKKRFVEAQSADEVG